MTCDQQLQNISCVCRAFGADVRYWPECRRLTVLAWEREGEKRALALQRQIRQQAANAPGLVCYCFDPFSTLVYAI